MKNLLLIASLFLAAYSTVYSGEPVKPGQTSIVSTNGGYISAVKVSQTDWTILTDLYKAEHEKGTWGGNLNKTDLKNWLSHLPQSCTVVYFRFFADTIYNKTGVGFSGGKMDENAKCIRNGGSELAFCPTACNLRSEACPKVIEISYQTYNLLSSRYKGISPYATLGGNIEKSALLNIINSLPDTINIIAFNFCTDPNYDQTSIIFTGGTVGQNGDHILYLRNGAMTDNFCPTNCNMD